MSITEEQSDLREPESDFDVPPAASENGGASILEHLARRRDELTAEETPELLLEVPAWRGAVAIRYRYPEAGVEAVLSIADRTQSASKDRLASLYANVDIVRACCSEVVARQGDGDWEPLDAGDPVRIGGRLATLLKIDVPSEMRNPGRFVARNLFSPRAAATGIYDGDVSILKHGDELITWLRDGLARGDESFAGE